jgi:hypothetical protein
MESPPPETEHRYVAARLKLLSLLILACGLLLSATALLWSWLRVGQVAGNVYLEGVPMQTGFIIFVAHDAGSTRGYTTPVRQGKFTLELPVASYRVVVWPPGRKTGSKTGNGLPPWDKVKEPKIHVSRGDNSYDFTFESGNTCLRSP